MSEVTTTDIRQMLTLVIFVFSIALAIIPFFWIGGQGYQVGVFGFGLAIFVMAFGYLFV